MTFGILRNSPPPIHIKMSFRRLLAFAFYNSIDLRKFEHIKFHPAVDAVDLQNTCDLMIDAGCFLGLRNRDGQSVFISVIRTMQTFRTTRRHYRYRKVKFTITRGIE
jgi:hypothetical protein